MDQLAAARKDRADSEEKPDTRSDIAAALRLAGPKVGHIHFADSNRHAIGFGHTDPAPIAAALRDIGYSGFISAEIFPLPDSETAAKKTIGSFQKYFGR